MYSSSEYLLKSLLIKMDELEEKQFYNWCKNNIKVLQENYKIDFKK